MGDLVLPPLRLLLGQLSHSFPSVAYPRSSVAVVQIGSRCPFRRTQWPASAAYSPPHQTTPYQKRAPSGFAWMLRSAPAPRFSCPDWLASARALSGPSWSDRD